MNSSSQELKSVTDIQNTNCLQRKFSLAMSNVKFKTEYKQKKVSGVLLPLTRDLVLVFFFSSL